MAHRRAHAGGKGDGEGAGYPRSSLCVHQSVKFNSLQRPCRINWPRDKNICRGRQSSDITAVEEAVQGLSHKTASERGDRREKKKIKMKVEKVICKKKCIKPMSIQMRKITMIIIM